MSLRSITERRKFDRTAPGGPLAVECRNMAPETEEAVRRWFAGGIKKFTLDGARSVRFDHPSAEDRLLKIKGAGFEGGPIRFGERFQSGLKAPVFDYEGRMMEDHAAGHDNAWLGASTFQQCVVEHAVTAELGRLGYRVVPCVGYGRLRSAHFVSWFSVFDIPKNWTAFAGPGIAVDAYLDAKLHYGEQVRELACEHGLIGYYWYMNDDAGSLVLKDLHPFRHAHPLNMSRTSWAMHVFFALHISALATTAFSKQWGLSGVPADAAALPFRAFHPKATATDHDAVRLQLVTTYMRGGRSNFDPAALDAFLRSHELTRRILEACPAEFGAF